MVKRLLASALALCAASSAHAAIITVSGSFTATNWSVYFGAPTTAPIDPLYLDYSVTFDDALSYVNDTGSLTVNSTNIPYAFTFSYEPNSVIVLATTPVDSGCAHPASSFCAFIAVPSGEALFVEQSPETGGGWSAGTITQGVPVVPEPSTWAMMIGGFGLAGAAIRRRRVTYGTKALAA